MWAMIIFSVATVAMLLTAQTKAVKEYVNTNIQKNTIAKMQSDQIRAKIDKKSDKAIVYAAIYGTAPTTDAQLQKVSTLGARTYKVDENLLSKRANPVIAKRVEIAKRFEGTKIEGKTLKMLPKIDTSFAQKSFDEVKTGFGFSAHGHKEAVSHETAFHQSSQKIGQMTQQISQHVQADIDLGMDSDAHAFAQKELEREYRELAQKSDEQEEKFLMAKTHLQTEAKTGSPKKSFSDFRSFGF